MACSKPCFSELGRSSTGDDVAAKFGAHGKDQYFLITGTNSGLGFETARVLASIGAKLAVTARTQAGADDVVAKLKEKTPAADIIGLPLVLSDLKSVQECARLYVETGRPLHVLINNAGIMAPPLSYTSDGFESQFGVNHMGHFALTLALLPVLTRSGSLERPARVVSLSSIGHFIQAPRQGVLFDDLEAKTEYDPFARYGQSKLCNLLFSTELNLRMKEEQKPVIAMALNPGFIAATGLIQHTTVSSALKFACNAISRPGGVCASLQEWPKSVEQGVSTTLLVALDPDIVPGGYYSDCKLETKYVHETVNDGTTAARLWDVSTQLLREKAPALKNLYF